jgi:hypothetical protein
VQVLWFSIIILWGTGSLLFWDRRKGELQTLWDLHNMAGVATARMEHRPDPTQLGVALDELLRRVDEEKAQAEKVVVFNLPAASSCTTRECSATLLAVLLTAVVVSCLWCHRGNETKPTSQARLRLEDAKAGRGPRARGAPRTPAPASSSASVAASGIELVAAPAPLAAAARGRSVLEERDCELGHLSKVLVASRLSLT